MVGSGIVALPWAYQRSGLLLGIGITFTSFLVSFYTCALVIKTAGKDADYIITLQKLFGKIGWYVGLIGPTILLFGALTVYFVVIAQSLYPLMYVLLKNVLNIGTYVDPT